MSVAAAAAASNSGEWDGDGDGEGERDLAKGESARSLLGDNEGLAFGVGVIL